MNANQLQGSWGVSLIPGVFLARGEQLPNLLQFATATLAFLHGNPVFTVRHPHVPLAKDVPYQRTFPVFPVENPGFELYTVPDALVLAVCQIVAHPQELCFLLLFLFLPLAFGFAPSLA